MKEIRFLVVDDHEFQARTLARMLRGMGAADVQTADGGTSALALLATGQHFDVVISDMEMPGLDGVRFIDQAAQVYSSTRFILMSATQPAQTGNRTREHAIGFLPKPITPSGLRQALTGRAD